VIVVLSISSFELLYVVGLKARSFANAERLAMEDVLARDETRRVTTSLDVCLRPRYAIGRTASCQCKIEHCAIAQSGQIAKTVLANLMADVVDASTGSNDRCAYGFTTRLEPLQTVESLRLAAVA
jgi:hypothetical protein